MAEITYERLLAFAAGEITGAEATEIEAHLERDPEAAAAVARYRALRHLVQHALAMEPSRTLIARAKAIFAEARAPATEPWWTRLEQVIANLVFDSRPQPALAGFRSAEMGFQLAFESDRTAIDLHAEPTGEGAREGTAAWQVMGQIDVADAESGEVVLVPEGSEAPAAESSVDDEGVFSLRVPPGRYTLYVRSGRGSIVCEEIELA